MKKTLYTLAILAFSLSAKAQFNNNLTLNGTTDYVEIPASSSLALAGDATVEARVRLTAANTSGYVFINCINPDNWGIYLDIANGAASGGVVIGGVQYTITAGTTLPLLTFNHIAVVRNGTSLTLYVNGVSAGSTTVPSGALRNSSSSVSRISRIQNGNGGYLLGTVDDIRVWGAARTASQISGAMGSELAGNETNLVAYYKLNETGVGAGITVNNSASATGTSLNGTTFGTAVTPIFSIIALPVKLLSFSAEAQANIVRLNWSTASENNIARYIVERSNDGIQYAEIAKQDAVGAFSTNSQYSTSDEQPIDGIAYYRLKVIGNAGDIAYSSVAKLVRGSNHSTPAIREVPVENMLRLTNASDVLSLTITDMSGHIVKTFAAHQDGSYDVNNLSAGMYIVSLRTSVSINKLQMIKQ